MKIERKNNFLFKILYPCLIILIVDIAFLFFDFFPEKASFVKSIFLVESFLTFLVLLGAVFYQKKSDQLGFFALITLTVKNILVYVFYTSLISGITQTFSDKMVFILIFFSFMLVDVYFTVVLLNKNEVK
ncbi:hypothetical protein DI487_07790 [Flavobacterium sediminis]|uniref:Uncharacterized protein n=1 Tax=Flavobacterium sediminis TaxID=2201181 RepID=A0A2U8QUP9_9FLAO|nr:hypothetical protein DI487_07790 [Flavobacterium sediminis]